MRQVIHAVAYQIWTTSGNNLSVTSSFINWLDNIYHKQRNPFNQVSQLTKLTISFHLPQTRAWIINLPIKSYWKRRIKLSNILKNFENTLNTVLRRNGDGGCQYEPNYWRISGEWEFDVLNRHIYIYMAGNLTICSIMKTRLYSQGNMLSGSVYMTRVGYLNLNLEFARIRVFFGTIETYDFRTATRPRRPKQTPSNKW